MARLRREAATAPSSPSDDRFRELSPYGPPIHIANTLTTFGTPQGVTLAELRAEMLREWASR
jgi:hypothetical protein